MKQHLALFAWISVALSFCACSMDDGVEFGPSCANWEDAWNHGEKMRVEDWPSYYHDAKAAGRCPNHFLCSFSDDRVVSCVSECGEGMVLCNQQCISQEAYANKATVYVEGHNYCVDQCYGGRKPNSDLVCECSCDNGCDKTGKCLCDSLCPDSCDDNGECVCESGTTLCKQGVLYTCNSSNEKEVAETCERGCGDAVSCVPVVCHENESKCNNSLYKICKNNAWEEINCEYGCDVSKNICANAFQIKASCKDQSDLSCNSSEFVSRINIKTGKTVILKIEYLIKNKPHTDKKLSVSITSGKEHCVNAPNSIDLAAQILPLEAGAGACEAKLTIRDDSAESGGSLDIDIKVVADGQDENHNHMDDFYEFFPIDAPEECLQNRECNSSDALDDGFCDSAIGYRCATRCSDDSQCISSNDYYYVCRSDGRCAPDRFVTIWETAKENESITIPAYNSTNDFSCDYDIDWGDQTQEHFDHCSNVTHIYKTPGEHTVSIRGKIDQFNAVSTNMSVEIINALKYGLDCNLTQLKNTLGDEYSKAENVYIIENIAKLRKIVTFGPVRFGAFSLFCATGLESVSSIDIPDSSKLTSLRGAFFGIKSSKLDLSKWDTSNVTLLSYTFHNAKKFNSDISRWNTSKVTSISYTFAYAQSFNQNIGNWDTSNLVYMAAAFESASSFNQDIGGWDVSKVTNMNTVFDYATAFNADISKWNTASAERMAHTFEGAKSFNQDISSWNTSHVFSMLNMFKNATAFNFGNHVGDIPWDTSSVTDMSGMFYNTSLDRSLASWDVKKVSKFTGMFGKILMSTENRCKIKESWKNMNLNFTEFDETVCP